MSNTVTVKVRGREKEVWQKMAALAGEDLSEFARVAVRLRVRKMQTKVASPWDDLLGSTSANGPSATNENVRKAMRIARS